MGEKLSDFGYGFQIKLLVALLIDKNFLEQINDILREEFFDSDANQWLVEQIKDYYKKYKNTATFDAIKIEIMDIENDILKATVVEHLRDINKNFNTPDLDYVKQKALQFCKNQKLKSAIMQSITLLENKQYEEIKSLINEASQAGEERDLGHDYSNDFEYRYEESNRKCVKTQWTVIDDLMSGGLGAGELGVIVSAAGGGKSWFLASIGANALKQNKKVIHYTLELSAAYTGLRYDSVLTGIPFQSLKYHKDEVKQIIDKYKDSLIIKQYPATMASVGTITAHIKRTETIKFKPDLIIIDYADLLTTRVSRLMESSYHIAGRLYEELRGLSVQVEAPIWTASQSNRQSFEEDIIEANTISDSFKKIMTADFVMSLSRKTEDKIAGTGRIHIIKNRFGPDGLTFNAKINASNGNIGIYDNGTIESKAEQKKQNNGNEYLRKMMSQKYQEMKD